ncbi:hypothetical protein [Variovorax sp.]|uniref:hypothetical protein n=1 Tax=Variovorax sp. TaxID=1871043 RepID=UPI002D33D64E|nr:hypothetical protein [Variovorax sp.]HYP84145.1 hypothetical protein [Variovorax sp.]
MSLTQVAVLLALSIYAIYRQSIRHPVAHGLARFKLAFIYAAVGLVVGGFYLPPDTGAWTALIVSLVASLVVGVLRGRGTRLWREADGQAFSQGTPWTIGLFLALVGAKFAFGAWVYLHHGHPHGGFGEVMLMIGLMVAMQAQIVWRRAQALPFERELRPA